MTIKQVHTDEALTLAQYRELEPHLTRPLTDSPLGSNPTRRANDAASSSVFDEPDRPAGRPTWRPVGPARTTERLELDDQRAARNRRRGPQEARTATQTADGYPHHPRNGDDAA